MSPHRATGIDRRSALALAAGAAAATAIPAMAALPKTTTILADGLGLAESPLLTTAGALLVCDVLGKSIVRIGLDGSKTTIVALDGMPAGIAAGPDGALYVASIGAKGPPRSPGCILRIDPANRAVTTIVDRTDSGPVFAADDLVFDTTGGFYFTDTGNYGEVGAPIIQTGVYYCDGKVARRVTGPTLPTNGIGLSPGGDLLYWTENPTGRVYCRKVLSPGVLAAPAAPNGDCVYARPLPLRYLDSLRVDSEGFVTIAIHDGTRNGPSALLTIGPDGSRVSEVAMPVGLTTSLALAWVGKPTAFVTTNGRVLRLPWPRRGQRPPFLPAHQFET